AGMLADARHWFWSDTSGPEQTDRYVKGRCRKEYIILLTDGAPNMDLRTPSPPGCSDTNAPTCPYSRSEDIADDLYKGTSGQKVKTYVVGFAVSNSVDGTTPADCKTQQDAGTLQTTCASTDPVVLAKYDACCKVDKIAYKGGTSKAVFVDTS